MLFLLGRSPVLVVVLGTVDFENREENLFLDLDLSFSLILLKQSISIERSKDVVVTHQEMRWEDHIPGSVRLSSVYLALTNEQSLGRPIESDVSGCLALLNAG